MSARIVDPAVVAVAYRNELRTQVEALPRPPRIAGLLTAEHGPSKTYADYTRKGCDDVGVTFDLRQVERLQAEEVLTAANEDGGIDGIFIYYPIFGTGQDRYLRDLVAPEKDIEGLGTYWLRRLYENKRFVDDKKAIVPCTPLAIMKLLEAAGAFSGEQRPLMGRHVCIFNRSEVVGRPLAGMMANDGATVVSFDVDAPQLFVPSTSGQGHSVEESSIDRAAALAQADVVITGVPDRAFPLVRGDEIKNGAVCLNFSTFKNFHEDVLERAGTFIPRVGPMTVTMALRNALRLHQQRA